MEENNIYKKFELDNVNNNFENINIEFKELNKPVEFTILMPCLNEQDTIGSCIKKAQKFIKVNDLSAEILVVDNGSIDDSACIAEELGARVIVEPHKGYGNAVNTGNKRAKGKYIIVGDSDMTYDFSNMAEYVDGLRKGSKLIVGNRFKGVMQNGAMPFVNKFLETSLIAFESKKIGEKVINDYTCGFRGYDRQSILDLNLQRTGIDYNIEMIVKANLNNISTAEVGVNYYKDQRKRFADISTFSYGMQQYSFLKECTKDVKAMRELQYNEFLRQEHTVKLIEKYNKRNKINN